MGLPVVEMNSSGTVTAKNVYGPDGLVARHNGSAWTEYVFDQQGNVAQRLNTSQVEQSSSAYDGYGVESSSGSPSDPFGYNAQWGYYLDRETGLYACMFRYYDPGQGRWLNRDPIGYAGGVNVYGYCGGGPVGRIDPLGLGFVDVMKGIGQGLFDQGPIGQTIAGIEGCFALSAASSAMGSASPWEKASSIGGGMWSNFTSNLSGANGDQAAARAWTPLIAGIAGGKLLGGVRIGGGTAPIAPPGSTVVSRWGRGGLSDGDWVMSGPATLGNYIRSGKMQPGAGNKFALPCECEEFVVPNSSVGWPSGSGLDGWWKGLFGQRKYN